MYMPLGHTSKTTLDVSNHTGLTSELWMFVHFIEHTMAQDAYGSYRTVKPFDPPVQNTVRSCC